VSVCDLGSILLGACVLGWVWRWLGALSMLLKGTFNVAESDVYPDVALLALGIKFQKKKGTIPFSLLLLSLVVW